MQIIIILDSCLTFFSFESQVVWRRYDNGDGGF